MSSIATVTPSAISVTTAAEYNASLPTYIDGDETVLQTDQNGRLLVVDQNSALALNSLGGIETNTGDTVTALNIISTTLTTIAGYVDGLEGFSDGLETLIGTTNTLITTLNGYTDGLEALIGTTNTALTTLQGYVDGLEGFTDGLETLIGTTNSTLTTLGTYVDGLETLITSTNTKLDTMITSLGNIDTGIPAALGQTTMANSMPVVIASNQTDLPVSLSKANAPWLSVVDQIDTSPGPVWDTSSTNINGSAGAFVVAVASLAAACKKIRIADTTGLFIGVYTGAPAAETLAFIINPGQSNEIEHSIAAATRITVRAMDTTAISSGLLCMQFLG